MLLVAGAAVDLAHFNGWTPLNCAADNGQEKCVELLLRAHAAVDLANPFDGRTPLLNAAEQGQVAEIGRRPSGAAS